MTYDQISFDELPVDALHRSVYSIYRNILHSSVEKDLDIPRMKLLLDFFPKFDGVGTISEVLVGMYDGDSFLL